MDEKKFGMLDEKQQKKYLFKENVRLNELKQELEADREIQPSDHNLCQYIRSLSGNGSRGKRTG